MNKKTTLESLVVSDPIFDPNSYSKPYYTENKNTKKTSRLASCEIHTDAHFSANNDHSNQYQVISKDSINLKPLNLYKTKLEGQTKVKETQHISDQPIITLAKKAKVEKLKLSSIIDESHNYLSIEINDQDPDSIENRQQPSSIRKISIISSNHRNSHECDISTKKQGSSSSKKSIVLKKKEDSKSSPQKSKHFPIKYTHNKTMHNFDNIYDCNQMDQEIFTKNTNEKFNMNFKYNSVKFSSPKRNSEHSPFDVIKYANNFESKMESNRQRNSGTNLTIHSLDPFSENKFNENKKNENNSENPKKCNSERWKPYFSKAHLKNLKKTYNSNDSIKDSDKSFPNFNKDRPNYSCKSNSVKNDLKTLQHQEYNENISINDNLFITSPSQELKNQKNLKSSWTLPLSNRQKLKKSPNSPNYSSSKSYDNLNNETFGNTKKLTKNRSKFSNQEALSVKNDKEKITTSLHRFDFNISSTNRSNRSLLNRLGRDFWLANTSNDNQDPYSKTNIFQNNLISYNLSKNSNVIFPSSERFSISHRNNPANKVNKMNQINNCKPSPSNNELSFRTSENQKKRFTNGDNFNQYVKHNSLLLEDCTKLKSQENLETTQDHPRDLSNIFRVSTDNAKNLHLKYHINKLNPTSTDR